MSEWTRRARNWLTLTPLRAAAAGTVVVVLLAGLGFGVYQRVSLDHVRAGLRDRCGAGVIRRGQCIGVTDGSYKFRFQPQLDRVERAIHWQNHLVNAQPHVTIALLMPLTSGDRGTQTEILHAVQGAYVAQYRADSDQDSNSARPKIRLVLANPGVDSIHWRPVVRQLAGMTGAPDHLRVVFGISLSTVHTKAEVHALTADDGIPVVTGAPTADDLSNVSGEKPAFPGLARVSATNSQEATALSNFVHITPHDALLVEDSRVDDDYITTLTKAFSLKASDFQEAPLVFHSAADISQPGYTSDEFTQTVQQICGDSSASWIFFAGRQVQLRLFINALTGHCGTRKFTILAGDAASHLAGDKLLDKNAFTPAGGITLDFPAIASPDAWIGDGLPATGGSAVGYQSLSGTLESAAIGAIGPTQPLTDGQTIINYDAALTAIAGVRGAESSEVNQTPIPVLSQVADEWPQLHGYLKVEGASGWICLDNAGNPYDKAVAIVQYHDSATPRFRFLGWPAGKPPAADCAIPAGN